MRKILALLLIATIQTYSSWTFAEYRAFLLKLTTPDGEIKLFKSTLDPLQYPTYHHLKPGELLTYDTSWMCPGRTSNQPICENPADLVTEPTQTTNQPPTPERTPAAEVTPSP